MLSPPSGAADTLSIRLSRNLRLVRRVERFFDRESGHRARDRRSIEARLRKRGMPLA